MAGAPDDLEARISQLRAEVRRAAGQGDRTAARELRAQVRKLETEWDSAVLGAGETPAPPAVPVREHVHRALTLLSVPSAPKLVLSVHEAFYSGELVPARLTSLRRDEERSYRAARGARPYYICAALTADLLAPARGVLALSTWSLPRRIVGPLSPRVDLLTSVIRLAHSLSEHEDPPPAARRLMWRLSVSIPGAGGFPDDLDPRRVVEAAQRELEVHREADTRQREQAARRAAAQLPDPATQLFGSRLGVAGKRRSEAR